MLARPALFLIEPWASTTRYTAFGSTWTGDWRMRVEPIHAQDAYAAPFGAGMGAAFTSICGTEQEIADYPESHPRKEFHAPISLLRVAQAAESNFNDVTLLEKVTSQARRDSLAKMLGGCHNILVARDEAPLGDSYLARRGAYALHVAGAALSRWVAPKPLHAVDGGLGGRTTLYKSLFAGVEPPAVHIRTLDATAGPYHADNELAPAVIAVRSTLTVYASQTAYGTLKTPSGCAWTSSNSTIKISESGPGMATAALQTTGNTGTATVTATCTLTTGAQQSGSVVFTVAP